MNICAADKHIQDIERYIRTVKDRVQSIATTMPFLRYQPILIVEMVYNPMFWLNSFPIRNGTHTKMCARMIMTRQNIHLDKHCQEKSSEMMNGIWKIEAAEIKYVVLHAANTISVKKLN